MNANFTQNLIMSTITIEQVFTFGKKIYKQQTGFHVSFLARNCDIRTRETRSAK